MFGGYTVCECNKGWSRLPWDSVSVMVLWLSVVLSVALYYKIDLLDFSFFSLSASGWCLLSSQVSSII